MMKNYFKVILTAIIVSGLLGVAKDSHGQVESQNYLVVRFVVQGVQDVYHAAELDEQLRAHPDIWMSRTDFNTRNYLGFFDPNTDLDAIELRAMLSVLGMDLKCYTTYPNDGSRIEKLNIDDCDQVLPPQDNED